jgi:hypothetical protein
MSTKINALQKSQIKAWLNEESYSAVYQILQNKLEEIRNETITGQNAFDELKMLHYNQGRVEALVGFFDSLDKTGYE